MEFRRIQDLGDLTGSRVLVRVDLNVPMVDGKVSDDTRLQAVKSTIDTILRAGGKALLLAHFGRPQGRVVPEMSLAPVVPALSTVLERPVILVDHRGDIPDCDIVVLENTRFLPGEEKNDPELAKYFASLGDYYVNDAFSAAHRAHASTEGVAHLLPSAAGETMARELAALEKALGHPEKPVAALVGGAKVSSKIAVLKNLVTKTDHLIIGGGMANTFLMAKGVEVGASLKEPDYLATARVIIKAAEDAGCQIHLPLDAVCAKEFKAGAEAFIRPLDAVEKDDLIFDVGPKTITHLENLIAGLRTLVWNGPLGAFEISPFETATKTVALAAARACKQGSLIAVAGGGDTVAALNVAGAADDFSFISTAGGAFLEWLEGRDLPGIQALLKA